LVESGLPDLISQCRAVRIHSFQLAAGNRQATVSLPDWRVVSRERLDAALVEAAIDSGAQFLPHTLATLGAAIGDLRTIELHGERGDANITARVVLAADGLGGRLLAGESGPVRRLPTSRVGVGAVATTAPEDFRVGVIYMAYGTGGYLGVVRREDGLITLAAALDVEFLRAAHTPGNAARRLLGEIGWPEIPGLGELAWRGTPPLTWQPARPAGERVLAIGDAIGYVEPFTGEGIGWALASAVSVVPFAIRSVRDWRPRIATDWTALQSRMTARRRRLCRATTWVSRRPRLSQALIAVLERCPWLAAPVVRQLGVTRRA
jgi:flavin-dependent dehydrogenase